MEHPNDWIENHLYSPWHKLGVVIMLAIDMAVFGVLAGPLIWAVQMAWIPFWAAGVINGLGHFWGYRNFSPRRQHQHLALGILIGGEELHNNHHTFPTSAKLSIAGTNSTSAGSISASSLRLAWRRSRRWHRDPAWAALRPVVDLDTLQAVITNRYDVLSQYARR
jgi:stearoyl-CoA desaturase (delta-9 desaturase)